MTPEEVAIGLADAITSDLIAAANVILGLIQKRAQDGSIAAAAVQSVELAADGDELKKFGPP